MKLIFTTLIIFLNISCATTTGNIGSGIFLGATSGAALGAHFGKKYDTELESSILGGAILAFTGGLIGWIFSEKSTDKNSYLDSKEIKKLKNSSLETLEVPERVIGNQLIESHKIYILRRPKTWIKK